MQCRSSRIISGNIKSFLRLKDTPDSFLNQAGKVVAVNATETDLEFITVADAVGLGFINDTTVYNCPASAEVGDFVYLSDATTVGLGQRDNNTTVPLIGAIKSKPSSNTCIVQTLGYLDGYSGLTPGSTYFLDLNGKVTSTRPTAANDLVQIVGVAKTASRLEIRIGDNHTIISA